MTDNLSTVFGRTAPTGLEMEPATLATTTTTRETTTLTVAPVATETPCAECATSRLGLQQPRFDADQLLDLLTEMQAKFDQSGLTSSKENAAFNKRNKLLYGPMQRFRAYAFAGWPGDKMTSSDICKFEKQMHGVLLEMLKNAGIDPRFMGQAVAELSMIMINIIEDRGDMESMNPDKLFDGLERSGFDTTALKSVARAFLGHVMMSFASLAMAELGPGAAFQVLAKFQVLMLGDKLFEQFGLEGTDATWADFGFALGLGIAAMSEGDGRPMGPNEVSHRLNDAANDFRRHSKLDNGVFCCFDRQEMKVFNAAVAVASSLFQPLTETPDAFKDVAKEFMQLQTLMAANAERLKTIVREVQDGMTGAADILGMPQVAAVEVAV